MPTAEEGTPGSMRSATTTSSGSVMGVDAAAARSMVSEQKSMRSSSSSDAPIS